MITIMSGFAAPLFSQARSLDLAPGQALFRAGDPVRDIFLLRKGRVHLIRHTSQGAPLILQNAAPGQVLAEASAYSPQYHCDGVALERATLSALPRARFLAALAEDPQLAQGWAAMLARGVQSARLRAEIRSLPRVAHRLDAWLAEGNPLPDKGQWQTLAGELGITREALYRELARRRRHDAT